ncbi:MAG: hypothetical protein ACE5JM_18255, partial [Armatimonadota bacterium]
HPPYVKDLVACNSCHSQVTTGTGEAEQARCFNCHNEPDRILAFENTTLVHRVHITTHNVECMQCHTPIVHRVVSLSETFQLDCQACHQGAHDEQKLMYAGLGGHGAENMPSTMFLARVSCQSCHAIPADVAGHERVYEAGEAACMSCHGIRYANILPSWQREIRRRLTAVARVVEGARQTLGATRLRTRAVADSLLSLAEDNLRFVEHGEATHNIAYADQLLRTSLQLVREAVRVGRLPYSVPETELGPPIAKNSCLQCHIGVEDQRGRFADTPFDHEPHVKRAGLDCELCHTPLAEHGGITLKSRSSCDDCHHRPVKPMNCARCHKGPGGAPEKVIATRIGDFPHPPHLRAGLACAGCHTPPEMSARGLDCQSCHLLHHQPENSCLNCHRGGVLKIHPVVAHTGCVLCHGEGAAFITRWTRQVCTVCHADKVEHNAPADCVLCHSMPPPAKR